MRIYRHCQFICMLLAANNLWISIRSIDFKCVLWLFCPSTKTLNAWVRTNLWMERAKNNWMNRKMEWMTKAKNVQIEYNATYISPWDDRFRISYSTSPQTINRIESKLKTKTTNFKTIFFLSVIVHYAFKFKFIARSI